MSVDVFEGLDDDDVERLQRACAQTRYAPGQTVFDEGDAGDDLFIVRSGRVRIAKALAGDVARTLAVVERGGVFGELALVGSGTRSATATALEDTVVLALSRERFVELTEESPRLGVKVMGRFAAILAERLHLTTDLLRDTIRWGLEVSGAAALDLHHVVRSSASLVASLSNGDRVTGQLVKVEPTQGGLMLTIADDEALHLVPYHAVVSLRLDRGQVLPDAGEA